MIFLSYFIIKAIVYLSIDENNKLRRGLEHYKVKASQFDQLRALRLMINK